jgi:hypothetical protein
VILAIIYTSTGHHLMDAVTHNMERSITDVLPTTTTTTAPKPSATATAPITPTTTTLP